MGTLRLKLPMRRVPVPTPPLSNRETDCTLPSKSTSLAETDSAPVASRTLKSHRWLSLWTDSEPRRVPRRTLPFWCFSS